ncbi:MAG: hypothetical protein UZ05_CHB002002208 [Chlorobi bacterium OLB5]|nr:MAG: hypothetical protein UZ05_CHB002002208 [Chlorobi bacterium OLB5]
MAFLNYLEGVGKTLQSAQAQLICFKKIAPLKAQNFLAFFIVILAVYEYLNALCSYDFSFRSAGVFKYTGYTQYLGICYASAICSLVGVLLSQKALRSHSYRLSSSMALQAHLNRKAATASTGFASFAPPQPVQPLHTALLFAKLSKSPLKNLVNSTLRNLIKNAIMQKFVSIGVTIFARNCNNCKILCP